MRVVMCIEYIAASYSLWVSMLLWYSSAKYIYVPQGAVAAYQADTEWGKFNIQAIP